MSDSVALWTIASQAPLSMRFSRQKYWSGLPFPPPRDLPDPGMELVFLMSPTLASINIRNYKSHEAYHILKKEKFHRKVFVDNVYVHAKLLQ